MNANDLRLMIGEVVEERINAFKVELNRKIEDNSDVVLTRKEAADFLKISLPTLWKLTKETKLKSHRIKSKVYYFESDLMEFLKAN